MCMQSSSRNVGAMRKGVGSPRDRRAMCMQPSSRNVRATCKDVGPPRDRHAMCMQGSSRNLRAMCKGVGSPRKRRAMCMQDSSRNAMRCRRVVGSPRNSRAMGKYGGPQIPRHVASDGRRMQAKSQASESAAPGVLVDPPRMGGRASSREGPKVWESNHHTIGRVIWKAT